MKRIRWVRVLAFVAVVGVAGGFVLWRLLPAEPVPASPEMRAASQQLASRLGTATPEAPEPPSDPQTDRERLMAAAYEMRGIPYEWAAKGPDKLDCSGFTKAAYAKVGVRLPDGSFNQGKIEEPLESLNQLVPGDILFYRWSGDTRISHVTLYAGDGWAIGTGSPGQPKKVVVYPLASDLKVRNTVVTYRHVQLRDE